MHSQTTIQRWVSAVQEHTGSYATRIPILGFPQRKQQKRHCWTSRHECCKSTNANKTPQMACHLRACLLCHLALWGRFTSSYFVVLQFPASESSITWQILHRFGAPTNLPPSRSCCRHPPYSIIFILAEFFIFILFIQLSLATAKSCGRH